jgi:hypothetical protein
VAVRGREKGVLCYNWCQSKGLSGYEGDGVRSTGMGSAGDE